MRRYLILAALAPALLLAGVRGPGPARADAPALRIGVPATLGSLDPDSGPDAGWVTPGNAVYDGLLAYAPDGVTVIGRLATAWSVSPDGLAFTLQLRKGVRFHDGAILTSADVKASLQRRLALGGILAARLDGIASIATPDAATVVLHLSRPLPWLPDVLAGAWGPKIISASALQAHDAGDAARGWLRTHEAGTGPFMLAEYGPEHMRLERVADAAGRTAASAAVDVLTVADPAARLLQLHVGALDLAIDALPAPALGRLPDTLAATIIPGASIVVGLVNPLGHLARDGARQAAMPALNARTWVGPALHDTARPPGTMFPQAMLDTLDPLDMPDDYVVAHQLALRLSTRALQIGYPAEQADLLRGPLGLVGANLSLLGFDVDLRAIPSAATARFADNPSDAPDLWVVCATTGEADAQSLVRSLYATGATGNVFGLIDPTAMRLAVQAEAQTDHVAMLKQYQLLSAHIFDVGWFIPLADIPAIVAHRADLTGITAPRGFPPGALDLAGLTRRP